jgi:hypothetical protein
LDTITCSSEVLVDLISCRVNLWCDFGTMAKQLIETSVHQF